MNQSLRNKTRYIDEFSKNLGTYMQHIHTLEVKNVDVNLSQICGRK